MKDATCLKSLLPPILLIGIQILVATVVSAVAGFVYTLKHGVDSLEASSDAMYKYAEDVASGEFTADGGGIFPGLLREQRYLLPGHILTVIRPVMVGVKPDPRRRKKSGILQGQLVIRIHPFLQLAVHQLLMDPEARTD